MDPVSQGLAGAVFAQLAARRAAQQRQAGSPLRSATIIGALAGMAPDLDVLIRSSSDPLMSLEYHRHFTHALLFAPIGASVVALLVWLFWRRLPFASIWLFAFMGWLSHGLLDTLTSYGTMLWWPLSTARLSLDWVSIIDPAVTVPVLVMAILASITRKRAWSGAALIWALAYFSLGAIQNDRGLQVQSELAASRNHIIERGRVMPSLGNLLVWRSVYRVGDTFHTDGLRVGPDGSVQVYPGGKVAAFTSDSNDLWPGDEAGQLAVDLDRFAHFADRFVGLHGRHGDLILLGDLRYGMPVESITPLWGIGFSLANPSGRPSRQNYGGTRDSDVRGQLWQKIKGEHCEQPECIVLAP